MKLFGYFYFSERVSIKHQISLQNQQLTESDSRILNNLLENNVL